MRHAIAPFALLACLALPAPADEQDPSTIHITGAGSAAAAPDIATIRIGVEFGARTAADAMAETSAAAAQVIAALKAAGVEPRDLQTRGISVQPVYNSSKSYSSGDSGLSGYRAYNDLAVRVRDLDALGKMVDLAVKAGANRVNAITFGIDDTTALKAQARREAVADARVAAETFASAAGLTLGDILSIREGGTGGPVYHEGAAMRMSMDAAPPVERGELAVTANVEIVWELEGE